ncbi:MAG: cupredoxin domain-containing protein [Halobacteriales archaeon]|nr:cupredoxin domain-containing protein [Halobacteriales archaeon]
MRLALLALALLAAGSARAASLDAKDDGNDPRFAPFELTAAPGEQVTLRDAGQEPHTLTSVDAAWTAVQVNASQSASFAAPAQPGDYRFFCAYHASPQTPPGQGMAGVLHVPSSASGTDPNGSSPPTKPTPDLGLSGLLAALALGLFLRRRP